MNLTTYYDKAYFDGGKGYTTYDNSGQYEEWADDIIQRFNPESVLDIGCAKGFLVKAFRDRGVKAWGVDISEYAISLAPEDIADYLYQWDVTSAKSIELPKVDLVVSTDTFEHIPESQLHIVQAFMLNHGKRYFIRVATPNTPDWEHDASHITIQPIEWWREFWEEAHFDESI